MSKGALTDEASVQEDSLWVDGKREKNQANPGC